MKGKKLGVMGVIWIILCTAIALAQASGNLNVIEPEISIVVSQGELETVSFTVMNTGANPINSLSFTNNLDLIDNDGDTITLTFNGPSSPIQPGASAQVSIDIDVDPDMDFETYSGTVTVTDPDSGAQDTFELSIEVQVDVCDFGQVGNDLQITIEDPDANEEFEPGDEITVDVKVDNVGNDDIRTQVEAFLFSDKREVTDASSDSRNLEDGEEEDFTLSLDIPLDANRVSEDDEFLLVVKAFDDDNEGLNCVQEAVRLNIELKSKKLVFKEESTKFLPAEASCGDSVVANVNVFNVGSDDLENVVLTLQNSQLKISKKSGVFSVEAFDSEEDNQESKQFALDVPLDAKPGSYSFVVRADYSGGSITTNIPLRINSCQNTPVLVERGEEVGIARPVNGQVIGKQGKVVPIAVQVENTEATKVSFVVAITNIDEIGESVNEVVTVNPGEAKTVFVNVDIANNAPLGIHSGVIELQVNGITTATNTVAIEVAASGVQPAATGSLIDVIPLPVIIVLMLLVGIGIFLVAGILLSTNRNQDQ